MSYFIMLSFITLLVLFYIYLNKYFKEEIKILFKSLRECFDEISGHREINDDDDETKYDYYMWKKEE